MDLNETKRIDKNALLFTLSFGVMGGIFGLINDAFRSYIRIVNSDVSKNFTIYIGIAMIILTLVIISINKFGFKKILIFLELLIMVAFFTAITIPNSYILPLDIIALQLGYKAFNFIIILVMVSYSSIGNRIFRFARALLLYVFIEAIVSMFDGNSNSFSLSVLSPENFQFINKSLDIISFKTFILRSLKSLFSETAEPPKKE